MSLQSWGFGPFFQAQTPPQGLPARVVAQERGRWRLITAEGERTAQARGLLYTAGVVPVVGDWVLLDPATGLIEQTLERRTVLERAQAGTAVAAQAIAANVDLAFVVMALDGDYNLRRLERYLVLIRSAKVRPVVVLSKLDRAPDLEARLEECRAVAGDAPIYGISALHGIGLEALAGELVPGETVALLGSSGVGKSTLLNALLGEERQKTAEVRAGDDRGKHTTTSRSITMLPGGALLIDSPGLREVELWIGDESTGFGDIEALAAGCRFGDCTHQREPGCAVREAVDPARLASFHKLGRELAHQAAKLGGPAALEEKRKWKVIHKALRRRPRD